VLTTYICRTYVGRLTVVTMQHCNELFLQIKQTISQSSILWQQQLLSVLVWTKYPSKHIGVVSDKTSDKLKQYTRDTSRPPYFYTYKYHHHYQLSSAKQTNFTCLYFTLILLPFILYQPCFIPISAFFQVFGRQSSEV